ncbi:MAG: N-acetyl-gamma-glutamyl-phosphate reductase [Acetobacter sp.]|nr:N-acetyl-gamma-glutamyl-phosphate reductase [Bacteroides sp.]MCM1340460.1 N-acetyl-gamma-glutamyl-phosphate reductase [Acetobacter sp.]MCM1433200.1 N-acetyl-gamma-glutamyl-phosphate reductase [Clostridiales bacterium]
MKKIFIDGKDGTTGLKIYKRFENRSDIELLLIDSDKRKDAKERARLINESDITFLCLPDAASIEAVSLVENDKVKIIDTSTAHRTLPDWAYGFAELSNEHRSKISASNRIAVPGCYASGFNSIVYPLVKNGFIDSNYDIVCFALSGYTGAGKKGIAQYEDENRDSELDSPRLYALTQEHKHLREMKAISGLSKEPIFSPVICDYPQGMVVTIPLYTDKMTKKYTKKDLYEMFNEHYGNSPVVKIRELGYTDGMIASNTFENRDDMEIEINGNEDRILITSRFDNLGKGASGAAIQCMNIAMGIDETTGLNIGD